MWPVILAATRAYVPYVVLPFSIVIGTIGYLAERNLRDANKAKEQAPSTLEARGDRQLEEKLRDPLDVASLKSKEGIPRNIFGRNDPSRK